jgi:hypothetical protein
MSQEMTIEELMVELHELRETPSQEFAAGLDARTEAGFPRDGRAAEMLERLRPASPRRMLLPALGAAATLIVVATAVVATSGGGGDAGRTGVAQPLAQPDVQAAPSSGAAAGAGGGATKPSPGTRVESAPLIPAHTDSDSFTDSTAPQPPGGAPHVRQRRVERSAELTLGTSPDHVQDVAGKVFDVVGRYRGIVLSSSVRDGREGEAGASFEVLIPSARLSGALTDLSDLAEVRSRSENTLDITAPFVSARERLRDARAEVEGLLRQLAAADTDTERASVKAQLQIAHGRVAAFRSQVDRLERRSSFSHLSLDIATGDAAFVPTAGGDDWTIGDALADAGRLLAIAAGVALVSLALALPLGLLGGAAWAGRRIYVRRARRQALGT